MIVAGYQGEDFSRRKNTKGRKKGNKGVLTDFTQNDLQGAETEQDYEE